ncbi:MAG TPA: hypothetical protein VI757_06970, partial [Bacteroidia bacterium]|nr:hypothetical protein [Bacteroidia bacterium]
PQNEKAISKAAGQERDRVMVVCFDKTLVHFDGYLLPYKYTNAVLYSRYSSARAIDNSGGGADTNGYDVHNYPLAPGASVSFMAQVAGVQQLYFRQLGGTVGVIICTAAAQADACAAGFVLVPAVTVKKTFDELGLAAGNYINFTNPGSETVTVRAGLKT